MLFRLLFKNTLAVHYLSLIIIVLGTWIFLTMQREARPNVDFNRVNVSVVYTGASPSDVEELVIDPIEEKIAEVDGIEDYRSVSYVGAGSISIRIDDSYPDPSEIIDELRRKISEVRDLPVDVDDPVITEAKAINKPVLNIALYGSLSPESFKLETEKLKDYLMLQSGVQSVSYTGIGDLQLQIRLIPEKLESFDITVGEVISDLSSWIKQKPGGLLENSKNVVNITIGKNLDEIDVVGDFVVRSNDVGNKVRLRDIADISFDLESIQSGSLYEEHAAVLFTIVKKPFFDSIKTVDNLNQAIETYRKRLTKDLNISIYKDESIRIRNKLKIVTSNAWSGLILVIIVLLIFLDWRSAVVTSIGIPIAILGGFVVLYLLGQTLNSLVVVGIIIVLGMLVDDAIVVCENIYSNIEQGFSSREAAIRGVRQIALPVLASVLTTVFAFFPIIFMGDIIGQFMRVIPITVISLLSISLFEAIFILPIHADELMKPKKKGKKKGFFGRVESCYESYICWSLRKRKWLLTGFVVFISVSTFQGVKIFEKFSLFPSEGLDGLSLRVESETNTPIENTREIMRDLTRRLMPLSENNFDNIYSTLGQVTTGGNAGSRQNGAHLAMLDIGFVTDPNFIYREKEILSQIKKISTEFAKERKIKISMTIDRPGPPVGKPIQLQVTARNMEVSQEVVEALKKEFALMKGVHSLETDLDGNSIKYQIVVDNELAISQGISPLIISNTVFSSSSGKKVSELLKNNDIVELLVAVEKGENFNKEDVLNLRVRNSNGQAVPLRNFVKIIEEKEPSSIQRFNGLKTITLFGEVDEKLITGAEANQKIKPIIQKLQEKYQSVRIQTDGGEKDRISAVKDTSRLYILALFLIFIVISLTFNSMIYPFLVLTTVPMGLAGVIWALLIHGKMLTLMGVIGIVGLSGVVVNVAILYLKFIQEAVASGDSFQDAIIKAGINRLRPIVMTTISTLIGLLPTIYGLGGVDTFVQPIALVLGWGLLVATILTLLFLPLIVSFFPILGRHSYKSDANLELSSNK